MELAKSQAFHEVCSLVLAMEKNRTTLLEWLWSEEYMKVYEIIQEMEAQTNMLREIYVRYMRFP